MQRLGPYELRREIARGGMGVVYEARHPEIPRALALKQILEHEVSPEALARFRLEAESLARVQHPNVVRVHELGSSPQGPYLVTDYVAGRPLDQVLETGVLDPAEAARIASKLAGALEAIHAVEVVHRDLKPSNVILTEAGEPILLDFGLARDQQAERMTRTGEMLGTPAYMAPEQAIGGAIGPFTDVYGLGAVLFCCLSGRPPATGPLIECLRQVVEDEPDWPDAPESLLAILRRALAKPPERRYATARQLRDDLERFLGGGRVRGQPRRGRLLFGAVVTVALVVVLVVAGVASRPPEAGVDPPGAAPASPMPVPTRASPRTQPRVATHRLEPGPERVRRYEEVCQQAPSPKRAHELEELRRRPLAAWRYGNKAVRAVAWPDRIAVGGAGAILFRSRLPGVPDPTPLQRRGTIHALIRVEAGLALAIGDGVELVAQRKTIRFGREGAVRDEDGVVRGQLRALALDPIARRVAGVGTFGQAVVIDLEPHRVRWISTHSDRVSKIVALHGDRLFVAGLAELGSSMTLVSLQTGAVLGKQTVLQRVTCAAFLDDRRVAVASSDGSLQVWDGSSSRYLLKARILSGLLPNVRDMKRIGDRLLLVAFRKKTPTSEVRWFDVADLRSVGVRQWPLPARSIDVSNDGRQVLVSTYDGRVELWATPFDVD